MIHVSSRHQGSVRVPNPQIDVSSKTFEEIRDECLRRKILFEDPEFPANNESLYFNNHMSRRKLEWKRPKVRRKSSCEQIAIISLHLPVGLVVKHVPVGVGGLGFDSRPNQIEHCRQWLVTAAMFLCCPGAKSRRWIPPLVLRFVVISRV